VRRFAFPLMLLFVGPLVCPSTAAPILVQFEGRIETIEDSGRWAEEFELFAGGSVDAVYGLDPDEGVIQFGDGRYGARIPSGGNVMAGTYRSGGGRGGSLLILDDCWVSVFACVAGQGGDAYLVQLAGVSPSGVDFDLVIGMTTTDDSVLGGDAKITLLPPDPDRFENAWFRWLLTDGVRTSEMTGSVSSLRLVPEPSTLVLVVLGVGFAARQRRRGV
jgi:hypothetical protein